MNQKEIEALVSVRQTRLLQISEEQLRVARLIGEAEANIVSTQASITRGELQARSQRDLDWRIRAGDALTHYKTEKIRLQVEAKELKTEHASITQELRDLRRLQTVKAKVEEFMAWALKTLEDSDISDDDLEKFEDQAESWIAKNVRADSLMVSDLDGETD